MPKLSTILQRPNAIPASFEASLPGIPKLSGVMNQLALNVPIDPVLPDLPGIDTNAGAAALPFAQPITQFIQSIEAGLPPGAPKISSLVDTSGFRPIAPAGAAEEKKPVRRRILGSGYRSI